MTNTELTAKAAWEFWEKEIKDLPQKERVRCIVQAIARQTAAQISDEETKIKMWFLVSHCWLEAERKLSGMNNLGHPLLHECAREVYDTEWPQILSQFEI